jgi:hypothetical protein
VLSEWIDELALRWQHFMRFKKQGVLDRAVKIEAIYRI